VIIIIIIINDIYGAQTSPRCKLGRPGECRCQCPYVRLSIRPQKFFRFDFN